jgi:hypothetical protein
LKAIALQPNLESIPNFQKIFKKLIEKKAKSYNSEKDTSDPTARCSETANYTST